MNTTPVFLLLLGCGSATAAPTSRETPTSSDAPASGARRLIMNPGFGCALLEHGARCWGDQPDLYELQEVETLLTGASEIVGDDSAVCGVFGDEARCTDHEPRGRGVRIAGLHRLSVGGARCAIDADDRVQCWSELTEDGEDPTSAPRPWPHEGAAIDVVVRPHDVCVLSAQGDITCRHHREAEPRTWRVEGATALRSLGHALCAATEQGPRCFLHGQETDERPPSIAAGEETARCWIERERELICRASSDGAPRAFELPSPAVEIAMAASFACARTSDGSVYCSDARNPEPLVELASDVTSLTAVARSVCATTASATTCASHRTHVVLPADLMRGCTGAWFEHGVEDVEEDLPTSTHALFCPDGLRAHLPVDRDNFRDFVLRDVRAVRTGADGLVLLDARRARLLRTIHGYSGAPDGRLQPLPGLDEVIAFDRLGQTQCAVRPDGAVLCGAAFDPRSFEPTRVAGIDDATDVVVHARGCGCARRRDGRVACFEIGGEGSASDAGLSSIAQIASDGERVCALAQSGRVTCSADYEDLPPSSCAPDGAAILEGATALASGQGFTCALTLARRAVCWGDMYSSELRRARDVEQPRDVTLRRVAP